MIGTHGSVALSLCNDVHAQYTRSMSRIGTSLSKTLPRPNRVHQVHGVVGLLKALGEQLWLQRMEAEHCGAGRGERYTGPKGVT